MKNIIFSFFILAAQVIFAESKSPELLCDANQVQDKDWSEDVQGYQQENYEKIFPTWLSKAEQGTPKYQFYTAKAYYFGKGVDKNLNKAVYWYKKSSKQGYPIAKNNLAVMYEVGEVVQKNTDKAFKLFCGAAIQGVIVAQDNIINIYIETRKDSRHVLAWVKIASVNGSEYAKSVLAQMYVKGLGVEQDFKKAKHIYLDLYNFSKIKAKRANAALYIAEYYDFHASKKKTALEWYLISAKLGSLDAKYQAAGMLYDKKEYKQAFKWSEIASKEGNASATQLLGNLYRNGWGVKQDLEKSVALALKAESLGSVQAMFNLAVAYDKGEGVKQNKRKALNWYLKYAKEEGRGQHFVGIKYMNGDGVDVDLKKAAFWLLEDYKNNPKSLFRFKLAIIYYRNSEKGLEDIPNLSRVFLFDELLPSLNYRDLSMVANEVKNLKEAIPLWEMAAEKGSTTAMGQLGMYYSFEDHPEYGAYYDLNKAVHWLIKKDYKQKNINTSLALARIYFGLSGFSHVNLEEAYKYSLQAVELFKSGLAEDHWLYEDKLNVLDGMYDLSALQFADKGMHEISEILIRKNSKLTSKNSLSNYNLAVKMHLASLSQYPEEYESVYLDVINKTEIKESKDLLNLLIALDKLSDIYVAQYKHQKAIDMLTNNLKKVLYKEEDLSPYVLLKISYVYLSLGDFGKAKEYLFKYKVLISNTQNELVIYLGSHFIGSVLVLEGVIGLMTGENFDDASTKFLKGMKNNFKTARSSRGVVFAENVMGEFVRMGRFNYAYEVAKPVVEAYMRNFNDRLLYGVEITSQEKQSVKNILSEFIYVTEKSNKSSPDLEFEIMQLAAGLTASDALVKTIYKKQISTHAAMLLDNLDILKFSKQALIQKKLSKINFDKEDALIVNSKLDSLDKEIHLIKKEISQQGIKGNLMNAFINSTQDVIDILHKKDALLTMLISKERTFVWLITSNGVYRHHANVGSNTIETDVKKLLDSLDPNKKGSSKFPLESSSRLYDLLISPFEQELKGINRLVISPDSVLSGIPFSILNDTKSVNTSRKLNYINPSSVRGIVGTHTNISTFNAHENNWLINRFAISVAPSIYSYIESAKLSKTRPDSKDSFIGIGNPILTGATGQLSKNQLITHVNTRGSISNFVSEMTPLPETEKELSLIAKSFSKSDLIFGKEATEKKVKEIDLSQYSVVAFATHALVSNEIEGIVEPSLILTPVDENNPNNDGLLTASEISNLKLDAEIVLLSACNTASAFGESNSQGLSGLANSFFNAGARSLLVSYWSVISESAVDITTRIFKPSNEGRSYAHKHRNAVLDLLQNSKDTYKLHPSYWAPFSVIGVN